MDQFDSIITKYNDENNFCEWILETETFMKMLLTIADNSFHK